MSLVRTFVVRLWTVWLLLAVACPTPVKALEDKPAPHAPPPASANYHRLPAHYKDVVDERQREAIYQIQEEFGAKIADLKTQLAELQKRQAAKIEAVLSPEQKQKIAQLKTAAATRRRPKGPAAKP